jgi:CBS domain-containing protein
MKVSRVMSGPVHSVTPQESIFSAARLMAADDIGVLPVTDDGRLVGMVTDRDIVVRAVASGIDLDDEVGSIMSPDVQTCRTDDDIDGVLETMSTQQVRRLPVCDAGGAVVGIVSMGDLARFDWDKGEVAETLSEICEPTLRRAMAEA